MSLKVDRARLLTRARLAAVLGLVVVLLPITGGLWAAALGRDALAERVEEGLSAVAESLSVSIGRDLSLAVALTRTAANLPSLRRAVAQRDGKRTAEILTSVDNAGILRAVGVFDGGGHLLGSAQQPLTPETRALPFATDAAVLAPRVAESDALVVVREPIRDAAGQTVGVLLAEMSLARVAPEVRVVRVGDTGIASLVSRDGLVLLGPVDRVGRPVPSESLGPLVRNWLPGRAIVGDGRDDRQIAAFVPAAGHDFGVLVEQAEREAFAAADRFRNAMLLGSLLLACGAGLVAWLVTRNFALYESTLVDREVRTRTILEAAADAFVAMDEQGLITEWNPQAEAIFGWPRDEAIGRTVADTIVPERLREAHRHGLAHFLASGEGPVLNKRIEISAMHRDGREFPVELSIWPAKNSTWSFYAFVRDISARRAAAESLAEARDVALTASKQKSEFLANMSHEIRTPMNGIIGMTGLLLGTRLDGEQREYAETVRGCAESLLTILNDILDFSKIEAGKLSLEAVDFDVRAVVEGIVSLMAEAAQAKNLELAVFVAPEVPARVEGDPGRLRQVLLNLVGNAVKFTDSGEVVVRARQVEDAGDTLTLGFEVADTGIGIAPDLQKRLFGAFEQADASTTRRFGGTGLGLAISRKLVELMHGTIEVASEPGHGSTFRFSIQVGRAATLTEPALPQRPSLRGLRVLVVDDHAINRSILEQYLASWEMVPTCVADGEAAVAAVRAARAAGTPFDLVVLDRNMPGMDGFDVARVLRGEQDAGQTKMVLLTSSTERGDATTLQALGIAGHLTKPVRQSALFNALASVMGLPGPLLRAADTTPAAALEAAMPRPHVLLVEDNPVNQKVATRMLEKLGCRVELAADGAQAVEACRRDRYDAVLMDCQMPVLDGYDATRALRQFEQPTGRHTPILAMTAAAMPEDRARCFDAGMDDYISKPVTLRELADVLSKWVGPARGRRAPVERANAAPLPASEAASEAAATAPATPPASASATAPEPPPAAEPAPPADAPRQRPDVAALIESGVDAEVVRLFIDQTHARLARMRELSAAGDAPALAIEAHNLKGTAATVGAGDLAALAKQVEAAAAHGDLRAASTGLDALQVEYEAVSIWLPQAFAGTASWDSGPRRGP